MLSTHLQKAFNQFPWLWRIKDTWRLSGEEKDYIDILRGNKGILLPLILATFRVFAEQPEYRKLWLFMHFEDKTGNFGAIQHFCEVPPDEKVGRTWLERILECVANLDSSQRRVKVISIVTSINPNEFYLFRPTKESDHLGSFLKEASEKQHLNLPPLLLV